MFLYIYLLCILFFTSAVHSLSIDNRCNQPVHLKIRWIQNTFDTANIESSAKITVEKESILRLPDEWDIDYDFPIMLVPQKMRIKPSAHIADDTKSPILDAKCNPNDTVVITQEYVRFFFPLCCIHVQNERRIIRLKKQ